MKPWFCRGLVACVLLALSAVGHAQERKAYRHVDAAGNVTYSQTPPVVAKESKTVDISPAQRGRGGDVSGGYSVYDNPRYYSDRSYDQYNTNSQPSARERRFAELKAECERQRGTDCNNPRTLQYLDSTHQPGSGVVVRRAPPRQYPPRKRDG